MIAVDPSSKRTQGALLGDRIRLDYDAADPGVFVRSIASRGDPGGLSDRTFAGTIILRSVYDRVLIETVGVGQSEADIADLSDTVVLVVQPGSGDMLQFIKSGIMEAPDIIAVNKSDQRETAQKTLHELRAAFGSMDGAERDQSRRVLGCSALDGQGIDELVAAIDDHKAALEKGGKLIPLRKKQAAEWVIQELLHTHGRRGVEKAGGLERVQRILSSEGRFRPFETCRQLQKEIESS
jgi:LAO/AO transport system kinase